MSRQDPSTWAAARIATISAWPVGSSHASRTLWPSPMTSPSGPTTTAPTGTSPACSASAASSSGRAIHAAYRSSCTR